MEGKEDIRARLKVIAEGHIVSEADEAFVLKHAAVLGVSVRKSRCKSCIIDAAIECWKRLQQTHDAGGYRLRAGVDVLFNGERVNDTTLTKARAERWLAHGLSETYFEGICR